MGLWAAQVLWICSSTSMLLAFDADGRSVPLFRCDEPLRSAPFLPEGKDLFVASADRLYCLSSGR